MRQATDVPDRIRRVPFDPDLELAGKDQAYSDRYPENPCADI